MKTFQAKIEEIKLRQLKTWAAQTGKTLKAFLIEGAEEKAKREGLK